MKQHLSTKIFPISNLYKFDNSDLVECDAHFIGIFMTLTIYFNLINATKLLIFI